MGTGDELDVPLEDPVQMEEVELLSSVMIQAGSSDEPLEQADIDRLLGIDTRTDTAGTTTDDDGATHS